MTRLKSPPTDEELQRYLRERRFARECALQYLYQADQQKDWGCTAEKLGFLRQQIEEFADGPPDAQARPAWEYAERLIRGVCTCHEALDASIGAAADNWRLDRMDVIDRNILRLAAYELHHCEDVPAVAVIDEAIELAKAFGHVESWRFVNGVVDRLLREVRKANATAPG